MSRLSILHVIESFGGGTASAALAYVRATPEIEHHLMYRERTDSAVPHSMRTAFASATPFPRGATQVRSALRETVSDHAIPIVHAHSSIAGFIARTTKWKAPAPAVVYSPHCFAFERRDLPKWVLFAFRQVERVLARRTTMVIACSTREAELARRLSSAVLVEYVPNVASVESPIGASDEVIRQHKVVALGRISRQKDPSFFASVARVMKTQDPTLRFVWVGGGDSRLGAEVESTGWIDSGAVAAELATARLYLHTAEWEGFPIALLDAHAAELPIVVRRIPAYGPIRPTLAATNPDEVAELALSILRDDRIHAENRREWSRSLSENRPDVQKSRLMRAYESARRAKEAE